MKLSPALCVVAFLLALGCKKGDETIIAPLGDGAPSMAQGQTLAAFMPGRWCLNDPMAGIQPKRYYEFKADGTFDFGVEGGIWKGTGKWATSADSAMVDYLTINGKPIYEFQSEYKKKEETGVQNEVARAVIFDQLFDSLPRMQVVWLDEDRKQLTFSRPLPTSSEGGPGNLSELMKMSGLRLMRMGPMKKEG